MENTNENNFAAVNAVTREGNPACPEGEAGGEMLSRMNESHGPVTDWALDIFGNFRGMSALDLGCGGGATIMRLLSRGASHVTGADISPVSLEKSRETCARAIKAGKVELVEGSAAALPLEAESFDLVTTVESFYFWGRDRDCLKEIYRVLKPGGYLAIIADIHGAAALTDAERENIARYNLFNPEPEEFGDLLRAAGFRGIDIRLKMGEKWICAMGRK